MLTKTEDEGIDGNLLFLEGTPSVIEAALINILHPGLSTDIHATYSPRLTNTVHWFT